MTTLGKWETNRVYCCDALELLRGLPDSSVNCIVTSPPYFGLRDYGVDGQLGLEATPDAYVEALVGVFREARRVLREDGTLFLNLGDSYFGSSQTGGTNSIEGSSKRKGRMFAKPSSVRRAAPYDTSDTVPASYQASDCLCGSLCDVCREGYQNRKSHTCASLVPTLIASLSESTRASMGFGSDHLPTSDLFRQAAHILDAIQDQARSFSRDVEQLHAFQASMSGEFSQLLLALCWQRGNSSACLLCGHSLVADAQASVHTPGGSTVPPPHTQDIEIHDDQPPPRSLCKDTACAYCAELSYSPIYIQPQYTTSQPKPKDLLLIPARVALALQADGWYLRSDIVWSKPNPMPESVTDRPTKSHEHVFLLAKSGSYWYDAEAIKEDAVNGDPTHPRGSVAVVGQQNAGRRDKQSEVGKRQYTGFNERWDNRAEPLTKRNKRDVWTIPTKPYKGAHFAVMPPELVRLCVLAGCPEGGVVLDMFMGSGTVARVAHRLGRRYLGCDINPAYVNMTNSSLQQRSLYELEAQVEQEAQS